MKLRYYLRGIGIGIIVAAAICICASLKNGKMTDEQVKQRASELGMTEGGAVLTDIAKATEEETGTVADDVAVVPEIVSISEEVVETSIEEAVSSEIEEESVAATSEQTEEQAPEQTPEQTEEQAPEPVDEKPVVTSGDNITFVIEKGNGSDTVARKLAAAGLIKDAVAYDKWLCQNGYDRTLAAGTHSIPKGASEEQIAKILTGRN